MVKNTKYQKNTSNVLIASYFQDAVVERDYVNKTKNKIIFFSNTHQKKTLSDIGQLKK